MFDLYCTKPVLVRVLSTGWLIIISTLYSLLGSEVAQWLRRCATIRKVAGSIPAGVIGFFIDIKSLRSHYGPGVDSASNRNEYQEYFLGVTTGPDNLPPSCAVVTKSGNLNFLRPSGPLRACNGAAVLQFITQCSGCATGWTTENRGSIPGMVKDFCHSKTFIPAVSPT